MEKKKTKQTDPTLKVEWVDIASIVMYEKNARTHPKKQIELIAKNIQRFGFTTPCLLDKDNNLIAGHGRVEAVLTLGWDRVPCLRLEHLSPAEVKALRIADNKLAELSEWSLEPLTEELKGLDEDLFELTGFDESFITEKYDNFSAGSIKDRFLIAPFSILNTRSGDWQKRKKMWLELGIKSEEGRSENLMGKGLTTLSQKQNTEYKSGVGLTGTSIFDPVLCEVSYLWFAPPKAKIIDPFAGGSVRGVVASKLGHTYHATELRKEQVEANIEQGKQIVPDNEPIWICDDAQNIRKHFKDGEYDMLMTCPPYADLEVYSTDPRDISNMSYDDFLPIYRNIIAESAKLLKENSFAVCVVGEVRAKDGSYYNFIGDTISAFEDAGLHYYNEIILVNMVGTLGMRITKQFTSGRKIGKTHQNVLVFWKGNPKDIKTAISEWKVQGDIFAVPEEEDGVDN